MALANALLGTTLGQFKPAQDPQATVSKKAFGQGVALVHAFLLFSVFVPPIMLCIQLASNSDLEYFVGTWVALRAYQLMVLFVVGIPLLHMFFRFVPSYVFLMSVWLPGFAFAGVGLYYWDAAYAASASLQSMDCSLDLYPVKAELQKSYVEAQDLYHNCHGVVTTSIEDCVQYGSVFASAPADFTYLKGMDQRFQCAGICNSAVRLWDQPGTPAPACGLFATEWLKGAASSARFVMWYSVVVILVSIPVFITLLESFFLAYYNPILGQCGQSMDTAKV